MTLTDGRPLRYAEYGTHDGWPVIYLHGFPSSRLEAALGDAAARRVGVRLVAVDRPGYGGSGAAPGRSLSDWPRDLEQLATGLGIQRFSVLGVSGGGPYALACARFLDAPLAAVGLVCPLAPVAAFEARAGMSPAARALVSTALRWPGALGWAYRRVAPRVARAGAPALLRLCGVQSNRADARVLARPEVYRGLAAAVREAFRHGGDGAADDLAIYTRDWGFSLADIGHTVRLWHGEADDLLPPASARWLAARLPHCEAHFVADEGHVSLPIDHTEEILRKLLPD